MKLGLNIEHGTGIEHKHSMARPQVLNLVAWGAGNADGTDDAGV